MASFPFPAGRWGTVPQAFTDYLERDPVPLVRLPDGMPVRLATRYPDVVAVLTDERFSRALAADLPGAGFGRSQRTGLLDLDPPEHASLRDPLDHALDEDHVADATAGLRAATREELARFAALPRPADLVAGFCAPLAARTICELVGLGSGAAVAVARDVDDVLPTSETPERAGAAKAALDAALSGLIAARRAHQKDDIASTLLTDGLSDEDAHTVLFGLLISGYVGNRNALARHVFALLSAPGAEGSVKALTAAPERAPAVVEELLRYYPSGNDGLLRVTRAPVVLSGVELPAGTVVMPLMAAAARDPEVYRDPDRFDPDRAAPPHLSLGAGTHSCPGAHLVRGLFAIVLTELAATLPELAIAVGPDDVLHSSDLLPLGLRSLPVTW